MASFSGFPGCCTCYALVGLGSQYEESRLEEGKKVILDSIVAACNSNGNSGSSIRTASLITAITTERQNAGAAALAEIGFTASDKSTKNESGSRHKETGALTLWSITTENLWAWAAKQKTAAVETRFANRPAVAPRPTFPRATMESFRALEMINARTRGEMRHDADRTPIPLRAVVQHYGLTTIDDGRYATIRRQTTWGRLAEAIRDEQDRQNIFTV